jgi:hypothetical protein
VSDEVHAGHTADDGLYEPLIEWVGEMLAGRAVRAQRRPNRWLDPSARLGRASDDDHGMAGSAQPVRRGCTHARTVCLKTSPFQRRFTITYEMPLYSREIMVSGAARTLSSAEVWHRT